MGRPAIPAAIRCGRRDPRTAGRRSRCSTRWTAIQPRTWESTGRSSRASAATVVGLPVGGEAVRPGAADDGLGGLGAGPGTEGVLGADGGGSGCTGVERATAGRARSTPPLPSDPSNADIVATAVPTATTTEATATMAARRAARLRAARRRAGPDA